MGVYPLTKDGVAYLGTLLPANWTAYVATEYEQGKPVYGSLTHILPNLRW